MKPSLGVEPSLVAVLAVVLVSLVLRYLLIAGGAFIYAHRGSPERHRGRRLAAAPADRAQMRRELMLSFGSIVVFTALAALLVVCRERGATELLRGALFERTGWSIVAVPVLLLLHDTWFYWLHRALHTRVLFKRIHRHHHLSLDPSPLAAFAFHPGEALAEAAFGILVLLVMPVPVASMAVFQLLAFAINVYGHLGVELLPPAFADTVWFRILNTTTHHHQHHRRARANYGLYFNVWDRLMGTNHPDYREAFVRRCVDSHASD